MSEIRDRDEFVLTVNRLMICAMEDIDCGRDEAGPTTLDLVQRIEDHDAALRAENERLREALFFYSNSEIYEETSMVHGRIPACGPPIIIEDGGERARAALAPAAAGKEG